MTARPITRKRLHDYIDAMPDYGLPIVEPLLAHFADEALFIETNLTAEEKEAITEGRKLRREHPEEFVSLDHYLTSGVT
jgi:hypothetical protein